MGMKLVKGLVLAALAVLAVSAGGCGQRLRTYTGTLVVSPDASLRDAGKLPPLQVDLVAVNDADAAEWSAYSMDAYFSGNDKRRAGARDYTKTLTFGAGSEGAQTVAAKDPIWNTWASRGA